jgi:DNA-binding SARP family transcriptional activator
MRTPTTETSGNISPKQHLRVSTFGRFQIEWVDPETGQIAPFPSERLRGQNAGSALGLFKALLSCPDRFATRSWLNEQFWPDSTVKRAEERLNDVVSSLRTLLRPTGSSEMLVHFVYGTGGRGAGYRLDSYPQLWCDADAFEWYIKHALLLDQRGQDSTACWEHAYLLAERGMYLPEQIEDDWSRPRRDYLSGLVRDCVHRWVALLRQMGRAEEAIIRLRSYWLEHPIDEDTLRPLIDMLGECGRFGEAEECYAKARAALAEENLVLDERTIDTIEAVRALKVQRFSHYRLIKTPSGLSLGETYATLSWREGQREENDIQGSLKFVPETPTRGFFSEHVSPLRTSANDPLNMGLFQQFSQALGFSSSLHPEQLDLLEHQTLLFWQRREGLTQPLGTFYLQVVEHLSHLKALLEHPLLPTERIRLCEVTSRMLLLAGVVLYDRGLYPSARQVMHIAAQAAREAGNTIVQGLIYAWMSFTWTYAGSFSLALPCILEAASLVEQGTDQNAKAWVAAVQAEIYANLSRLDDCLRALQQAEEALTAPKSETGYLYGLNSVLLDGYKGVCLQRFYQRDAPATYPYIREAKEALERALNSQTPLRRKRYYLGDLSKIEARCGEIEAACFYASQSLTIQSRIESKSMWQRIVDLRSLLQPYQNEAPVRLLETQIQAQMTGNHGENDG